MSLLSQTRENQAKSVVVAVSGTGRSLINLIEKQVDYGSYTVNGVITSNSHCQAYHWACEQKLAIYVMPDAAREDRTETLVTWLDEHDCQLVVLAGYLKMFPNDYKGLPPIVNIHPALLPKFGGFGMYGQHVHEAVLAAGERVSGASVHFVDSCYDTGSVISQIRLNIDECCTAQEIQDLVFTGEKQLLPYTVDGLVTGRLPLVKKAIDVIS